MQQVRFAFSVLVLVVLTVACGGVSRRFVVEGPRESYDSLFEALAQVSAQQGMTARPRRGGVTIVVDPQAGTRITYVARRNGIVMTVGVRDDGEESEGVSELAAAELERAEAIGRRLMDEARSLSATLEARQAEQARAQAIAEQEEQQRRAIAEAQEREENERRRAELDAMVAGQRARRESMLSEPASASASGAASASASGGASASAAAQCCINGAYYECPGAAEVDRCVGAFSRCIASCGLECMDECMRTSPPDPSGCRRVPANDGSC